MDSKPLHKRPLAVWEILRWTSAHREATGNWPTKADGRILGTLFETWAGIDKAL